MLAYTRRFNGMATTSPLDALRRQRGLIVRDLHPGAKARRPRQTILGLRCEPTPHAPVYRRMVQQIPVSKPVSDPLIAGRESQRETRVLEYKKMEPFFVKGESDER